MRTVRATGESTGSIGPTDHERTGPPRSVSIVVPTYREAANIPALVDRLQKSMARSGGEWELILVDDDSGDGSASIVANLAQSCPVRLEIRRDASRDLSLSVLRGFQLASYETLVVLDADLSHPPERIADLLAALGDECDMVVGSRYMPGGTVDPNWSWWSLLHSRLATALAAPLTSCADPMSGFFAVRRSALPAWSSLHPIGYKIGLELMVRGQLRTKEVPIDFSDREGGQSKVNCNVRVAFLRHLYRLFRCRLGSLSGVLGVARVVAARCVGFVVDVAGFLALQATGLDHRLARCVSLGCALCSRWLLDARMSRDSESTEARGGRSPVFGAASLAGLGMNVGSYLCLTTFVESLERHRFAALVCGICIGRVCEFLYVTGRVRFARLARAH